MSINLDSIEPFRNEPYTDFTSEENRSAMANALEHVRGQLGSEYDLLLAGERIRTGDLLHSFNPSRPAELVGAHHKANPELARKAVESAFAYFETWRDVAIQERVRLLLRAAEIVRRRKLEFNAWLVFEAGKTWPEAEAETAEAIDFCEFYARQMLRFVPSDAPVQMPGERDRVVYLPLGVGVIIPPWNFSLAILAGMTVSALVTGNTVVVKPSSDTPTVAQKFAEVLLEAGFPPSSFSLLVGSGAEVGDVLVENPKTRFISFTGSRDVGLRINELAAKPRKGQIWIKRVVAEMGGKDAIVVDREADLESAATGVVQSAFGYQGQKCSACSRAIVHEAVYEEFLQKLKQKTAAIKMGATDDPANAMGPVINDRAAKAIREYIDIGKEDGKILTGEEGGEGNFVPPTVVADIEPGSRLFKEEIFGPVLAVTKARDFDHALELANESEYGLTGAVYTNNEQKIEKARDRFFVGNLYINRKCTGAMVGAHPFGGFNMSGTDSKAGGPDYLLQFLQAKSIAEKLP